MCNYRRSAMNIVTRAKPETHIYSCVSSTRSCLTAGFHTRYLLWLKYYKIHYLNLLVKASASDSDSSPVRSVGVLRPLLQHWTLRHHKTFPEAQMKFSSMIISCDSSVTVSSLHSLDQEPVFVSKYTQLIYSSTFRHGQDSVG